MSDINHFVDGKQKLPPSVWSQTSEFNIYRGTPSQMVLEMMGNGGQECTIREALEQLVNHIYQTRNIQIQLPWQAPDEVLANLFVYTLLRAGIIRETPLA